MHTPAEPPMTSEILVQELTDQVRFQRPVKGRKTLEHQLQDAYNVLTLDTQTLWAAHGLRAYKAPPDKDERARAHPGFAIVKTNDESFVWVDGQL